MIPIKPQPEPDDFDKKVRQPGLAFLSRFPNPSNKDYENNKATYWRESLSDLYDAYNHICAYSAQWISFDTGSPTVDHFIPKSKEHKSAYEWDNFRLACSKMNSKKHTYLDVIDPFALPADSFIINFPSMLIKPNNNLLEPLKGRVISTIARLKLNEENRPQRRFKLLKEYYTQDYPFKHLKKIAPFIAYELERQDLVEVDKIAKIMGVKI
ncbi:HNH endonuclease [Dolichospermum heterosporum]|uniref:HNH endonuclease n=1 Tax=Dolichospermum heterosporum TAC447 TaxID=747523 RepID=A0ABY5LQR0_9CYAN|nr:HNH endonuclease [Dolichospermum heterosporum]UUO13625.1 HNH endonuclease [Dolichospermum heterosporum TAC447]